jgi:RHS repeat-associated protein
LFLLLFNLFTQYGFSGDAPPTGLPTDNTDDNDPGKQDCYSVGSSAAVQDGNLTVDYVLPSYRSLNAPHALRWVYNSTTADVRPILPLDVSRPPRTTAPQTLSYQLLVNGMSRGEVFYNGPPDSPTLTSYRIAMQFDANTMATGVYPSTMTVYNNYSDTIRYSHSTYDNLVINNQRNSPFGAGWGLAELQRLYPPALGNGSALLTEGNGTAKIFPVETDPPIFKVRRDFPTGGTNPRSVATGDFNGDRILDLAVVNSGSNTVSALLGDGRGGFGSPTVYNVGNSPAVVVAADFNQDGILDLAVANSTSNNLSILLGNGDGTFRLLDTRPMVESGPIAMAVADFDRDNIPDLAVVNNGSNNVSVLLGIGDGTFTVRRNFTVGTGPNSIAIADFNGDGKPDLATSNGGSNNVSILLGDGSGGFSAPPQRDFPVAGTPTAIAAGDLDNDGKVDIAVTNGVGDQNTVSVLWGNGTGGFPARTEYTIGFRYLTSIAAVDLNKDGILDLIVSGREGNRVAVLLGVGSRAFSSPPRTFLVGANPVSLLTGDFYPDGNLDLVTVSGDSNNISVLLGDGRGNFWTANNPAYSALVVITADFNNDGNLDLAVSDSNGISILLGDALGNFSLYSSYQSDNSWSMVAGDFNRDGNLDLAVANGGNNYISIFLGDGQGRFNLFRRVSVGNTPTSIALGDFNGDGIPDLAVANVNSNNVSILLGMGNGDFRAGGGPFPVETNPYSLVSGDFNQDGNLDLAVANYGSNNVSILLGDGQGNFAARRNFPAGTSPYAILTADFNRDGNLDLAVANAGSNNVSILLGDGQGGFSTPNNFPVGTSPGLTMATADFNRDGNLDLAVPNSGSSNVSILLGDGQGNFSAPNNFAVLGGLPTSVTTGDFNRDGSPDLATASRSAGLFIFLSTPSTPKGDFSRVVRNPDGTFARTMTDGTQINFNAQGLHVSTVDRNGNTTQYAYDDNGRLASITDPVGLVTTIEYIAPGLKVTDPAGRVTTFTIENGNLTQVVDPSGGVVRFGYDSNHHLTSKKDARNFTTQYDYNFAGRFARSIFPMERPSTERITKEMSVSQLVGLVDPASGLGTRARPAPITRTDQAPSTFMDCRGRTILKTDKFGARTYSKDALGRETTIERDQNSNPTKFTAPNGNVIRTIYDARGNVLTSTNEGIAATTTYTYDSICNQVASTRDPEGHVTTYTYDANCNLIETKDAVGTRTVMMYDSRGMLLTTTRAAGTLLENITRYTYDYLGNLTVTRDPLGNEARQEYDAAGNVILSTDAEGRTTTYEYDDLNRLTSVTDAADPPGVTTYTYLPGCCGNPTSLLASVTDANGHTTRFDYDEMGRMTKVTNPLNQVKTFKYDCYGNLTEATDARNRRITFDYDDVHQLTRKTWVSDPPTITFDYEYDRAGNQKRVAKKVGTVTESAVDMNYDGASRLIGVDIGGTLLPNRSINYRYDRNGNRTRMTIVGLPGETRYEYDILNRLRQLTSVQPPDDPKVFTFSYDALSRRSQLNFPNNTAATYTYDMADRLTSLIHRRADPIASFQYMYDRVGNRTIRTDLDGANGYDYDALNRLVHATHPQDFNPEEMFVYDPVGNRLASHLSTAYEYNAANRLGQDDSFVYQYDSNGNLTSKQERATGAITRFTFDSENQITRIDFTDSRFTEYKYDGLGRRIQKNVNGTITRYIYDGEHILLELDGNNNIVARYTHGLGIDEPLITNRGGQNYFYHVDGLGTTVQLTDSSSGPAGSYIYDSFGNIVQQTGDVVNPYAYTSREIDTESGLYYYRARYYDPQVGRFISEDPIGFDSEDPNFYSYVRNNPANFTDPFGKEVGGFRGLVLKGKVKDFLKKKCSKKLTDKEIDRAVEAFRKAANDDDIPALEGPRQGEKAKEIFLSILSSTLKCEKSDEKQLLDKVSNCLGF